MRALSFVTLLIVTGLTGCQREQPEPEPEPAQYSVPAEVEPFVAAFREEAKKHGNPVSTDNLIVTFGTVKQEDFCGQCTLEPGKTPRITLNSDPFCWQQANQQERECLVFHELGHCLLKRVHRADRFPKEMYVSLMNPDDVAVYAPCRYPIGSDECDKRTRRDYYIDELFDARTSAPLWGN